MKQTALLVCNTQGNDELSAAMRAMHSLLSTLTFLVEHKSKIDNNTDLNTFDLILLQKREIDSSIFDKKNNNNFPVNKLVLLGLKSTDEPLAKSALKIGVRGVFYANDSLDILIKGLNEIKRGHLWFKRNTMESTIRLLIDSLSVIPSPAPTSLMLTDDDSSIRSTKPNENKTPLTSDAVRKLTKREMLIVSLIKQGAQNKEVASQLNISINTVKTHVYSIFRKTGCRNRVELITWSMRKNTQPV